MPWSSASLEQGSKAGASGLGTAWSSSGNSEWRDRGSVSRALALCWEAYWRFSRHQLGSDRSPGPWGGMGATAEVGETEFGTCSEGGLGGPCSLMN